MKQLTINFTYDVTYSNTDFILSDANYFAYQSIMQYNLWYNKTLLLIGQSGSGKTHLARIWAKIMANSKENWVIAENIDEKCNLPQEEDELLHFLNLARENNSWILLTSRDLPKFVTPDLNSRIMALQKAVIKQPEDFLLKGIMAKQLKDRQLHFPKEVLDYIITRTDRSFEAIQILVDMLDHGSLVQKRNVSIPFVRNCIK